MKYVGDDLFIAVKDQDLTKSDDVGNVKLKLSALCIGSGIDEWFDLQWKGKKAGSIRLKGEWFPAGQNNTNPGPNVVVQQQ